MNKKVIVIGGSGGREHALAWKLSLSKHVKTVYIAPGNGGTGEIGENVDINPGDSKELIRFCKEKSIDLAVIGPDDLLADGLADKLRKAGIITFGASKNAARIESSKAFAKDLMRKNDIPTANYSTFTDADKATDYAQSQKYPLVVKASGLALGKGVIICQNFEEAKDAIDIIMRKKTFKSAGETIVIEEYIEGNEVSFHAVSDGKSYVLFPTSQDHKQIFDGDKGPNTGGMGVYGPISWVSKELIDEVEKHTIKPALQGLDEMNSSFSGCLYPGLMITPDGPKVLEYNARFGDPETQIYMRLLDSDLYELLYSAATGSLKPETIKWKKGFAISVVLASGGYPGDYKKGLEINGVKTVEQMKDIVLFHAGTKIENGKLVTSGGRVMNVTAYGKTLDEAITKAYSAVKEIDFVGMHYRKDIGQRAG